MTAICFSCHEPSGPIRTLNCCKCNEYFHHVCANVSEKMAGFIICSELPFVCPNCTPINRSVFMKRKPVSSRLSMLRDNSTSIRGRPLVKLLEQIESITTNAQQMTLPTHDIQVHQNNDDSETTYAFDQLPSNHPSTTYDITKLQQSSSNDTGFADTYIHIHSIDQTQTQTPTPDPDTGVDVDDGSTTTGGEIPTTVTQRNSQIVSTSVTSNNYILDMYEISQSLKVRSIFSKGKYLKPLYNSAAEADRLFVEDADSGGSVYTEPKLNDRNLQYTLIRILHICDRKRILFYCKYLNERGRRKEGWLDLIIVANLKSRSVFEEFMTRIFLFHMRYLFIEQAALKCDDMKIDRGRRDRYKIKLYPLIDPELIIPGVYLSMKKTMSMKIMEIQQMASKTEMDKRIRELKKMFK